MRAWQIAGSELRSVYVLTMSEQNRVVVYTTRHFITSPIIYYYLTCGKIRHSGRVYADRF